MNPRDVSSARLRGSIVVAFMLVVPLVGAVPANAETRPGLQVGQQQSPHVDDFAARSKRRAQSWVDAHVRYSQSHTYKNRFGTYRRDCSGYVSMAWRLGSSYSTRTLPDISHHIKKSHLQRGDVLLHSTKGSGHVVLFDAWANAAHTSYLAYEETPDGGALHRTVPYPYWGGSGTYSPYRKDGT